MFGLHWHWQNLRGDDTRSKRGIHGRAWLHWSSRNGYPNSTIQIGWHTWNPVYIVGAYMQVESDEDNFTFGFYLWPCSLYLEISSRFGRWLANRFIGTKWDSEREIQIVLSDTDGGTFRWNIWTPSMSHSSKTPKWRNGHFVPLDFIFGRWDYSNEIVSTQDVIIPMPEANYSGTVEMWRSTWTRRRFSRWVRSINRANVDVKNPPEFAGKGENSWDCDDDAIFSMTCPAESVEEAIVKYQESVTRNRKRYGNARSTERLLAGASD